MSDCKQNILEVDDEFAKASKAVELAARRKWGDAVYKYYKMPHYWRRGQHSSPITGMEQFKTTREDFLTNNAQGRIDSAMAFVGKKKTTYYTWERRVEKPGWKEMLAKHYKQAAECDE